MVAPEPYWEKLKRLRTKAGLAQHQLPGVSLGTVRAYEAALPDRYPSVEMLEKIAQALNVAPDEFDEYRLAKAREQLDERHSSLHDAVARLDRITEALQQQAAGRLATEAKQQAGRHRTPEATLGGEASPGGDG